MKKKTINNSELLIVYRTYNNSSNIISVCDVPEEDGVPGEKIFVNLVYNQKGKNLWKSHLISPDTK